MKGEMKISVLVAMDETRGIGYQGKLPWHLKADLRRFRDLTMGHTVIMGRKTWESIGHGLPGRRVIVLTRDETYPPACDAQPAHTLEAALHLAQAAGETEVFICGGGEVYAQALRWAYRLYLTRVTVQVTADAFFPPLDDDDWQISESLNQPADAQNEYPTTFQVLDRKTR